MVVDQYIAVASSDSLYDNHSYFCTERLRGLIQFWNLGILHKCTKLNQVPSMEFAIYHEHGLVLEMKWCPQTCYDDPSESVGLPRLGLLALACSDSCVRIYSVPQPNFMPKTTTNFPIYQTFPPVILTPLFGESCTLTARKSMAMCIEWQKDGQKIAAGYGNGSICVWMVKTSSTISKEDEDLFLTLQPCLFFKAGNTPITSLSFAPLESGRFLVCSSFDESLKYFDLFDPCMPFCTLKQGGARGCHWGKNFCGAYASQLDGVVSSDFVKESGNEKSTPQNVCGSIGSLNRSAFSEINNVYAIADMNGTVSLKRIRYLYGEKGLPNWDTYLIFNTEIAALDYLEDELLKETNEIILIDISEDIEYNEECVLLDEAPSIALCKATLPVANDNKELTNFSHISGTGAAASNNFINNKDMCVTSSKRKRIKSDFGKNDNMVDLSVSSCASLSSDNLKENQPFWIRNFFSSNLNGESQDINHMKVQSNILSPLHSTFNETLYKDRDDSKNSKGDIRDVASSHSLAKCSFNKLSLESDSRCSSKIKANADCSCVRPEIVTLSSSGDSLLPEKSCTSDSFEHSENGISSFESSEVAISSHGSEHATSLDVTERVNNFPPYLPLSVSLLPQTNDGQGLQPNNLSSNTKNNRNLESDCLFSKKLGICSATFHTSEHLRTTKPCFQSIDMEANSNTMCDILEQTIVSSNNITKEDSLFDKNPSYSSLAAKYGLIFKNISNNPTATCNSGKKESVPVEYKHLSAINTLSWNPNHGCHFWLFAAGSSGVARLTCVSDLIPGNNASPSYANNRSNP